MKWYGKFIIGYLLGFIFSMVLQTLLHFVFLVLFGQNSHYISLLVISIFTSCFLGAFVSMAYGQYINWIIFVSSGAVLASSNISAFYLRDLNIYWWLSSKIIIIISGVVGTMLGLEEIDEEFGKKYTEDEINQMKLSKANETNIPYPGYDKLKYTKVNINDKEKKNEKLDNSFDENTSIMSEYSKKGIFNKSYLQNRFYDSKMN